LSKSEFYKIIDEESVKVRIPQQNHFSVGTSPYYAHQHGLAIDIYHELSLNSYDALSPVFGRVIEVKKMIAPKPRFSEGINKEFLILIENTENSDIVYKFLHIEPSVKIGQKIEVGDVIGTTIRNGYFAPWSSPHLHLEIRAKKDMVRARGGKDFSLLFDNISQQQNSKELYGENNIPIIIKSIFPEFFLAELPDNLYYKISPFIGVRGKYLNSDCIIDGGIPMYKHGILLFKNINNFEKKVPALFNGKVIGLLTGKRGKIGFFDFDQIHIFLNNIEIRGVSFFLANFKPFIKIIPYNMEEHNYDVKSIQSLKFN